MAVMVTPSLQLIPQNASQCLPVKVCACCQRCCSTRLAASKSRSEACLLARRCRWGCRMHQPGLRGRQPSHRAVLPA